MMHFQVAFLTLLLACPAALAETTTTTTTTDPLCSEKNGLGSAHCSPPGSSSSNGGVSVTKVNGTAANTDDDADILWGITSETDGASIQFKVANPFPEKSVTAFVQYSYHAAPFTTATGLRGATQNCTSDDTLSCGDDAIVYEADCMKGNGNPYTLIHVYFLDTTSEDSSKDTTEDIFGAVEIHPCCNPPPDYNPTNVAEYTFIVRCACPTPTTTPASNNRRRLRSVRHNEEVDNELNLEQMMALFAESEMQLPQPQPQQQ